MPLVRTIVVISSRILRDGICAYLNDCAGVDIIACLDSIDSLPQSVVELNPDLILADLDLPDGNAIEGIQRVTAAKPGQWIIALAIGEERDYCNFAVRAGASTVIPKDLAGKLLSALVAAGPPAVHPEYERPNVEEMASGSL